MGSCKKPVSITSAESIQNANPHPVLVCRGRGRLTYGNLAAKDLVAELGLDSALNLLPSGHLQIKKACIESGQCTSTRTSVGGREISWFYRPIEGEAAVYLFGVDVTAHRRSRKSCKADMLRAAVLDQIIMGVIAIDQDLRVLFTNKAAHEILTSDGLSLQAGYLVAALQPITTRIRQMVGTVLQGQQESMALSIPRPSRSPVEILVISTGEIDSAAAFVFLFDTRAQGNSITETLINLHALTSAEARLVELLVGGQVLSKASITLGISEHTAKNQLQAVYKKTGTHRQGELIKLILAGAGGAVLRNKPTGLC